MLKYLKNMTYFLIDTIDKQLLEVGIPFNHEEFTHIIDTIEMPFTINCNDIVFKVDSIDSGQDVLPVLVYTGTAITNKKPFISMIYKEVVNGYNGKFRSPFMMRYKLSEVIYMMQSIPNGINFLNVDCKEDVLKIKQLIKNNACMSVQAEFF